LSMEYVRDPKVSELVLKRVERSESLVCGTLLVDKRAREALISRDIASNSVPAGFEVVNEIVQHAFPAVEPREKGEIFAFYRMAKTLGLPMVPYQRRKLSY